MTRSTAPFPQLLRDRSPCMSLARGLSAERELCRTAPRGLRSGAGAKRRRQTTRVECRRRARPVSAMRTTSAAWKPLQCPWDVVLRKMLPHFIPDPGRKPRRRQAIPPTRRCISSRYRRACYSATTCASRSLAGIRERRGRGFWRGCAAKGSPTQRK